MNHVIALISRQNIEILCMNPVFDPYANEFICSVREVTGMACVKAAVQADSPGYLCVDGAFDPVAGPWHELYCFDTVIDPLSALNVVAFSADTVAYKYARVRFTCKNPTDPLGINFSIGGWLYPVS